MRHERKYKLEQLFPAQVQQVLRLHPASFRKIYPDRQVNNIYFDTPDFSTYKDNVKGIADRQKYRVRWYGVQTNRIKNPRFEIKIKANQLGTKKIFSLEDFDLDNLSSLTTKVNHLFTISATLQPVLLNAYHRSYFGTSDGKYRITVDSNLRYFSMLGAPRFTQFIDPDPGVVVELKYEEELDDDAERIKQYLPFRQTKSSKYVTGVSRVIHN